MELLSFVSRFVFCAFVSLSLLWARTVVASAVSLLTGLPVLSLLTIVCTVFVLLSVLSMVLSLLSVVRTFTIALLSVVVLFLLLSFVEAAQVSFSEKGA